MCVPTGRLAFPQLLSASDQPELQPSVQLTFLNSTACDLDLLLPHRDVKDGEDRGLTWRSRAGRSTAATKLTARMTTTKTTTSLTDSFDADERRQLSAQLVLQLVDQFVDDGVQSQRDAPLRRQLQDGSTRRHVEAINGT